MSRAERRKRRENQVQIILCRIADVAAEAVRQGRSNGDAILDANHWIVGQMKKYPQESDIYRAAAKLYSAELEIAIEEPVAENQV